MYENIICPVCGRRFMVGVLCRQYKGMVCEKHCRKCSHFEPRFFHCIYKERKSKDAAEKM